MSKIKSILAFAALMLCGGAWAVEAPIPNVIWDGDFGTYMKVGTDGRTYKFALGSNTLQNNGASAKVSNATAPYITLPSGFGHTITVIIKYSSYTAPSSKTAMMFINEPTGNGIGVYSDGSQIAGFQNKSNGYGAKTTSLPETGYLTISYDSERTSAPCGTWGFPAELNESTGKLVCDSNANYGDNGLRYTTTGRVLDTCNVYLGGSSGANGKHPSMQNLVIEKVAIFGSWLTKEQIEAYEFKAALIGQTAYASLTDAIAAVGTPADEASAKTIHLLKGVAENVELKQYVTLDTHGTAYTGVVSGDGTVIFRGDGSDTNSSAVFNNLENISQSQKNGFKNTTDWHGTVVLDGYGRLWGPNSGDYGHANSVVQFTSCKGWVATAEHSAPVKLVDAEDGTPALTINNGSTNTAVTFSNLTGDGTLHLNNQNAAQKIKVTDGSTFAGSITVEGNKGIVFGSTIAVGAGSKDHNKIIVESGKTVTIATGKIWSATGGFYLSGTANGGGTINAALTINAGATIDVSKGALSMADNKEITFPEGDLNLVGATDGAVIFRNVSTYYNLISTVTKINGSASGQLEYNVDAKTITYSASKTTEVFPNTENSDNFDDAGNFLWTSTATWVDADGNSAVLPESGSMPRIVFDAKTIPGVVISGQITAGEVIVTCSDSVAHPFVFHNSTTKVNGLNEIDDTIDCLKAGSVNLEQYKGVLGLRVPIKGCDIVFGPDTTLKFIAGTKENPSKAYGYSITGRGAPIQVALDQDATEGWFVVPTSMYATAFAPESSVAIIYNEDGETISGAISGAGKVMVTDDATVKFVVPVACTGGLIIDDGATAEFTTTGSTAPVTGNGTLKLTNATTSTSTQLFNWFAANKLSGFRGVLELNKGRFETNAVLDQDVKVRINSDTQLSTGDSSSWNNYFYVNGQGWANETNYSMSKTAIRINGNIGADATLDFESENANIGTYNTNPNIEATVKGSNGFGLISDNANTFTFKAAKMTELAGTVTIRPNNTGNQNVTMVLDTEANDVTIGFTVANGNVKKTGSGALTLPDDFTRAITLAEGSILSSHADLNVTGANGATVYTGTKNGVTTYFLTTAKGWRVKDGVAVTTAEYYSRWSNTANSAGIINLKTTSNSTAGALHNQTVKPFDSATDTESDAWTGNWYLNLARGQSGYVAPGYTIRFASDITGTNKALDASFTPMSYSGIIVEPGAAGFSFVSWSSSDRKTELGSTGASTSSMIGEDFGIFRNKPTTIFGMHEIEIAEGKTLHINDGSAGGRDYSGAAYKTIIDPGATLKLVGAGKLSVGTLDASSATIDLSSIGSTEAAFIQGNITVDANTKISFPANWAAGTAMKLCSGTITGTTTSNAVAIRVGEEIKLATLTYADGAVSYAESDDPSAWVVSSEGDTKEITGDTTLSTVILNGTGKITGAGAVTLGDVTAGANGKLVLGAGVTLKMSTISIPDYLILEAGAKISGTAVPSLSGVNFKIADAENLQPGSYVVAEWTEFMGETSMGYGIPNLVLEGECPYDCELVCLVKKVYLKVISAAEKAAKPIKIWPVGDSITEGFNGSGNCANYRTQLAGKLWYDGHKVQMVGQNTHRSYMPSGEAAPDEWAWHSGVSAQLIWSRTDASLRAGYMEAIDAAMYQVQDVDIVTLMLGTNDIGKGDTAEHMFEGLTNIVGRICTHFPKSKVVIGTIVKYGDATKRGDYNTMIKNWIKDTNGDFYGRIFLADNDKKFGSEARDEQNRYLLYTGDNVHPTWDGHDVMSDAWLEGVEAAIAAGVDQTRDVVPEPVLGAENNVPADYRKLFKLNRKLSIDEVASYTLDGTTRVPNYTNVSSESTEHVTKIGYYMELVRKDSNDLRYVWVDMDIPAGKTVEEMLLPTAATIHQTVTGLHVHSNMGSVTNVEPNDNSVSGYLEFTPYAASQGAQSVSGAPAALWGGYDWNDTLQTSGDAGRGCMQIHRIHQKGVTGWNTAEVLFAYNNWGEGNDITGYDPTVPNQCVGEIGIGNFAQHYLTDTADRGHFGIGKQINDAIPGAGVVLGAASISLDYTTTRFSPWGDTMNAKAYRVRNLEIWTYDPTALPEAILNGEAKTFADAVAEADADDTIEIVKDVSAGDVVLEKDIKLTTINGADVAIAATFTGAHKLTKVGKGTIKLTGSNAFNAYDIQGGAVEMTSASAIAAGATLTGSGRVIFNQVCPTASDKQTPRFTIQNTWTGTIEFKNVGTDEILDGADIIIFGKWANMNSAIALNGVTSTMYSNDKTDYKDNLFVFGTLEICGNGWTSTTGAYGVSPLYKCNLTGNGTITVKQPGNGTHAINFVGNHSGFKGSVIIVDGATKGVVFSPADSDRLWDGIAAKKVVVQPGAVVGGSGTWTASAGIVVNGELNFVSQPTITDAVSGSGRLGFAKFSHVPSGVKTNLQSSNWTGTLVINGGALNDGTVSSHYTTLNDFGNADSKIELAGTLSGYFGLSMINAGDTPRVINPEIVIVGTWNPESGYSQADNSRNYCTIIRKLSGDGTINGTTGQPQLFYVLDGSEFTGALAARVTKFVFGARVDNSLITNGSVTVFDTGIISSQMTIDSNNAVALNGVVSLPAGSTLTAGDTIYSYTGTLNVGATARAAVAGTIDSRFTLKGANDNHDAVLEAVAEDAPIVVPVVPDAGVIVEPGANVTVPAGTAEAKISVKYTDANGTTTDLKTRGYVTVAVADNGAVTVAPTEAAKPEAVKIKMTLPKEGEGVGAKDKVSFTITDPIPGLFYSIVSADDPTEFDKQSGAVEDSDGVQATNSDPHTTSIDMPTDAKVKYFRVRVKATK